MIHFFGLAAMVLVTYHTNATQVMQRPADYATKTKPDTPIRRGLDTGRFLPAGRAVHRANLGKVNIGYFTNWGVYGRGFRPQDINVSSLTHVLYAFADTSPESGAVVLSDLWSDQQIRYPGDSWNEPGENLYGNFKQLYLLKKSHRHLKILLSVGGWTYSQSGHFDFVTDASKRSTFVSSALELLEDNGLDGFDLDFEYPSAGAQADAFSKLLSELRGALDDLAVKKGDAIPYQITAAVPAGAANYQALRVDNMDASLSFWNLMAYDYAGSWSSVTDHQANLYGPSRGNVDTDTAVKWYIANGAGSNKISLGIPLYGRAFDKTEGIGKPFMVGQGTWESGLYDYKALPLSGATVTENSTLGASYSYDRTKREFVSYDTPDIAAQKAQYVMDNQLGGAMFWELSGDKVDTQSLVGKTAGVFGSLDDTKNHLNYPGSRFSNVRNGMKGSADISSTSPPKATPSSSSVLPSGTSDSSTSLLSQSADASKPSTTSSTFFATGTHDSSSSSVPDSIGPGGSRSVYNKRLWQARWWSRGEAPSAAMAVSQARGLCIPPSNAAGQCKGVLEWSSGAIYMAEDLVLSGGRLWKAQWWTQGDRPASQTGSAAVWKDGGPCLPSMRRPYSPSLRGGYHRHGMSRCV